MKIFGVVIIKDGVMMKFEITQDWVIPSDKEPLSEYEFRLYQNWLGLKTIESPNFAEITYEVFARNLEKRFKNEARRKVQEG